MNSQSMASRSVVPALAVTFVMSGVSVVLERSVDALSGVLGIKMRGRSSVKDLQPAGERV